MSLPYHVGNGVFGGGVPFITTWLAVLVPGVPLIGLLYPIGVAAVGVVVSSCASRHTRSASGTRSAAVLMHHLSPISHKGGERANAEARLATRLRVLRSSWRRSALPGAPFDVHPVRTPVRGGLGRGPSPQQLFVQRVDLHPKRPTHADRITCVGAP